MQSFIKRVFLAICLLVSYILLSKIFITKILQIGFLPCYMKHTAKTST